MYKWDWLDCTLFYNPYLDWYERIYNCKYVFSVIT